MVDNVASVANLSACALYLYLAIGPVYDATRSLRLAKTIAWRWWRRRSSSDRFSLFFITLYGT